MLELFTLCFPESYEKTQSHFYLGGIWIHDPCNSRVVSYQLDHQDCLVARVSSNSYVLAVGTVTILEEINLYQRYLLRRFITFELWITFRFFFFFICIFFLFLFSSADLDWYWSDRISPRGHLEYKECHLTWCKMSYPAVLIPWHITTIPPTCTS